MNRLAPLTLASLLLAGCGGDDAAGSGGAGSGAAGAGASAGVGASGGSAAGGAGAAGGSGGTGASGGSAAGGAGAAGGSGGTGAGGGSAGSGGAGGSSAGSAGAGAGGAGGSSAGSGGGAGAAGAAGSAGSGGVAGSAGSAGTAGAAGAAGSGGGPNTNLPPLAGVGVETLAGDGVPGSYDGARDVAHFNNPVNVALGADGRVYVADFDNGLIRKVTSAGDVSTFTSGPTFRRPFGLSFAPDGKLWVQTDYSSSGGSDGALWSVDATGSATLQVDQLGRPRGLASLSDGRIVLSFFIEHRLAVYDPTTQQISPLAGSDSGVGAFVNATGASARFQNPYGVVVTSSGDILVADSGNHVIRKVTSAGVVTTFAGSGTDAVTDGDLLSAAFSSPQGLAIDGSDNVYVSETGGNVVRKLAAGQVSTIAGDGSQGWVDATSALQAQFYGLEGIAVSPDGSVLYIADGNRGDDSAHHRVRVLHLD